MSRLLRKIAFCSKTETVSGQHSDTECAVCQDQPVKPCTVPCGNHHVFCQACLQGLVTHNRYTTHFPCPLCRMRVRIPLGGVAAFRQGKGMRRHFLARIPVIRPRCRSPTDSVSTRWSDDLSLSGFDPGANVIIPGGYSSASDDVDSLSSLGVPSEGAESMNVEAWLNSIDPEQVMFLEEIRRQRALAEDSQSADAPEEAAERSSTSAEEVGNGAGGRADQEEESSFRVPGPDDLEDMVDIPAIPLPEGLAYGEDLDMRVVLQLIADMENRDRDNRHRAESTETEVGEAAEGTDPHQEEKLLKSPSQVSSETTNEIPGDALYPDRPGEISDNTDWKLRTIAGTAIPRPKVSLGRDMPEDGRSFSSEDDDEGLELPLPQQVSLDSPDLEEEVQEEQIFLDMLPPNADTDHEEEEGMGHKETETCPDQESQLSDTDCPTEWNSVHPHALVSAVKAETDTESLSAEDQKHNPCLTRSEDSEDWNPNDFSFNLPESSASTDHPHGSDETGGGHPSDDQSPEDWRRRELLRLQAAKLRRAAENPTEDLFLDTEVIISEGPNDWIRRIRSLQHRQRGPNSKRRVARSQSQGGKTECAERGVEKEEQERRRVEGRKDTADGEVAQKAIVGVGEEKEDLKHGVHGSSYVRNLTVVHL